jgi:tetratricopeptide (TPR) repeat protein
MDSRAVLQRFEQERQALALMDHPNIARVLDGGMTPTGQPCFVMELVNGLPLTKFCDEAKLTPKQRLELFVPICQAVQHAHQKGIVHRDLKPANILVTLIDGRGVPKIIDFGVAKATAGRLTDESLSTQFGAVVGTLEYMSPEQAGYAGEDIDTRADIYSLGVILYELLTGLRPIEVRRLCKAALTEMMRVIKEEEPVKPSTRLSTDASGPSMAALRQMEPKKLAALLRGELDWVVMKCLEKQRDRRYETANSLARDIQRYLADEIVEARPPSAGYRLKKLVRRHRGQVIAASLVLFTLLAGLIAASYGFYRADIQRQRAEGAEQSAIANAQKAVDAAEEERQAKEREAQQRTKAEKARDRTRAVLDAMTSEVTGDSLSTQKELSAEQMKFLTEVLTYYREFAGENADDEQSRARTAKAAASVGLIETRLGRMEQGVAALQIARDGYRALAADFPTVAGYRQSLASSHNNLGTLLAELGKREEAEEQLRQAQAIQKKLAADFPAVPEYRRDLAASHSNLGFLLARVRKGTEAQEQYEKALAIFEKLHADFPAVADYRRLLSTCHHNLGDLLLALGELVEAEKQIRKALSIMERLVADFPAVPTYRDEQAGGQNELGVVLARLGKHKEAEEQLRKGLETCEKLVADFPAVRGYQIRLGGAYCTYGNRVGSDGRAGETLAWFDKAIGTLEPVHRAAPRDVTAKRFLRNSYGGRGTSCQVLKKYAEAVKDWDRAIELSPPAEQPMIRGCIVEAVAEVAGLTKSPMWSGGEWYDFARVYAVASTKIAGKKQEYADRAMELLQKAVKAGYKDAAHMKMDTDLNPLRGREDFQNLVAEVGAKAEK